MSLVIQPCKPHRWHKNKCSGCQKETFDTFLFVLEAMIQNTSAAIVERTMITLYHCWETLTVC